MYGYEYESGTVGSGCPFCEEKEKRIRELEQELEKKRISFDDKAIEGFRSQVQSLLKANEKLSDEKSRLVQEIRQLKKKVKLLVWAVAVLLLLTLGGVLLW